MAKFACAALAFLFSLSVNATYKPVFNAKDRTFFVGRDGSCCSFVRISGWIECALSVVRYNVRGECVEGVDESFVAFALSDLKAEKVFEESASDVVTVYYYSPKICGYKSINGKKVNLQTATRGNGYIIATPMIFSGY